MNDTNKSKSLHCTGTQRLEMFCDGVFAIVITLLVLEIKLPTHEKLQAVGGLYNYLTHQWPQYFSYVLSFSFVGIYWMNHHWLFTFVKKTNHWANLMHIIFLLTIALMPYSSALLGEFGFDHEYSNAATTAYCIGFFLPVPTILIYFLYATHNYRLVVPNLSRKFINNGIMKLCASFTFSLTAIFLSFNYPKVSLGIILMLWVIFLMPPEKPYFENGEALPSHEL